MSKLSKSLIFFILVIGSGFLYGNDIFKIADSFHHSLNSATTNQKLLLSYAGHSSTPCCIAMKNATFHNQKVQDLLKTSFYPVKVDLSTSIGQDWATNFKIINTPTFLFFDNNGTLIKQVENCISSTELIVILEEVLFFNENGFWPIENRSPVVLSIFVPKDAIPQTEPATLSAEKESVSSTLPSNTKNTLRILLDQFPTNDSSIKTVVEEAKLKFPQQRFRFKLVKIEEQSYFQVWIGEFTAYHEAQSLLENLKNQGFTKAQLSSDIK